MGNVVSWCWITCQHHYLTATKPKLPATTYRNDIVLYYVYVMEAFIVIGFYCKSRSAKGKGHVVVVFFGFAETSDDREQRKVL